MPSRPIDPRVVNGVHDLADTGRRRFVATVFLRNPHPKQTVYVPIGDGWARVLRPAVTTALPERVLHTPAVRQLLVHRLVDLVDGAAWDADVRQRRASCTDMARAIAAAEQREFDRLRQGVQINARRRRNHEWSPEQIAVLHRRWAEGARVGVLALELGMPAHVVGLKAYHEGLGHQRSNGSGRKDWPNAQTARLRQRWAEGASVRTLAREFGTTTGAIAGKARRENLALRRPPGPR
jgi:hypothetical protein